MEPHFTKGVGYEKMVCAVWKPRGPFLPGSTTQNVFMCEMMGPANHDGSLVLAQAFPARRWDVQPGLPGKQKSWQRMLRLPQPGVIAIVMCSSPGFRGILAAFWDNMIYGAAFSTDLATAFGSRWFLGSVVCHGAP